MFEWLPGGCGIEQVPAERPGAGQHLAEPRLRFGLAAADHGELPTPLEDGVELLRRVEFHDEGIRPVLAGGAFRTFTDGALTATGWIGLNSR